MIFYVLFFILLILYFFIVIKRARKYKYNTSKDYSYNLDKNLIEIVELHNNSFTLPNSDYDTLFLQLKFSLNPISYFLKPYITIQNQKHYFE